MRNLLQKLQFGGSTAALIAASTLLTNAAYAQNQQNEAETVVVTGTSIRGTAPVGSNLITVGPADIEKTGAQTVQQVLANVPALTGMGNAGEGGAIHNNYYQPAIHQLGASASNATLVLIDGHRPPTGGTNHSTADPNIIPSNMIERVEVIANGASSTYGSDAVAGVVNFITRSRFDGLQLSAEDTFMDGASNQNFGLLTGSSWDKGSVIFAYQFYNQGQLLDRNRPFTNFNQTARAIASGIPITSASSNTNFDSFSCSPALVRINGTGNYFDVSTGAQYTTAQSSAPCNTWAYSTLVSAEQRNNAMLKYTQDLSDDLTIGADMVIGVRRDKSLGSRGSISNVVVYGPNSGKGGQINPFFQVPTGVNPATVTSENVYVNLDSLLGGPTETGTNGATSFYGDLTGEYKLFGDFVVDALFVAGRDESYTLTAPGTLNTSEAYLALNGTTNTGASTTAPSVPGQSTVVLNTPLTAANALDIWGQGSNNQTSDAIKTALLDNRALSRNIASFQQARLSTNGTLFSTGAGDVKMAIGAEMVSYQLTQEGVQSNNTGPASIGSTHTLFQFHRKVYSMFGELDVPVIGPDMAVPLMQKFELDVSGRYDDYSDAGNTANPKVGFTWDVVDGVRLRGNMSTSFVAPGIDIVGDEHAAFLTTQFTGTTITTPIPVAAYPQITQFPASFFNGGKPCTTANVTCTFTSNVQGGFINNGDHHAKPQKGRGWEIGLDLNPTILPDLTLAATYWDTQFTGGITGPAIGNIVNNAGLNSQLTLYPAGVSSAYLSQLATGIRQSGSLPVTNYFIYYSTNTNWLNLYIEGIDSSINYNFDTPWGGMHAGGVMTIFTKYDESYGVGGALYSILNTTGANGSFPSVQVQTRWNVGWEQGPFLADVYVNYTGGYRNWSGTSLTPLTKDSHGNPSGGGDPVSPNTTVDLHVAYNFNAGVLGDDQLSVTVKNVFDTEPPFYLANVGYDNWVGSPFGRIVSVGLQAKM